MECFWARTRWAIASVSSQLITPLVCMGLPSFRMIRVKANLDLLESRRRDFTVISGLSHPEVGGGHASEPCFLTAATGPGRQGFRNTQSMDRLMAEMRGSHTRFPSLQVGLVSRADTNGLSYDRGGIHFPSIQTQLISLLVCLFRKSLLRSKRKLSRIAKGGSVLDDLGVEARKMGQNLSPHDKAVLDDFFTALRTVEKELRTEWEVASEGEAKDDRETSS